jgi:chromosome segregation ATPase
VGDLNNHMGDHRRLGEIGTQVGDLQELIKEKDRHIETLETSLEQANKDKDYLKETHSNYMIQVQTIITQNESKQLQIEAPKKSWWKFW